MPRFVVTRDDRTIDIAFDDGGVNLLSAAALKELSDLVARFRGSAVAEADTAQPHNRTTAQLLLFRSAHPSIFAAGADMAEMQRFTPLEAAEFARSGQETFAAIEKLPMVTVAIVDGDCFGGALDLVMSFDLRFATPRSRFSHPGSKLGIVTGFGGTSRWRRVLDRSAARSLFLGNPVLGAEEAQRLGLVDRMAEEFSAEMRHLVTLDAGVVQFVKELTIHADALGRSDLLLVAESLGHIYFSAEY